MNLGSVSSITKSWCLQGLAFFYKVLIYKISVIVNLLCQLNYAVVSKYLVKCFSDVSVKTFLDDINI